LTEINDKKLAKTFNDALDVLANRLNTHADEPPSKGDSERVEIARTIFVGYPKIKAAQAQVASVGLKILSAAAESPAQYRELVKAHMPQISPLITIPQILDSRTRDIIEVQKEKNDLMAVSLAKEKEMKDRIDELQFENMQLKEKANQK
jgi:hypothetical protein